MNVPFPACHFWQCKTVSHFRGIHRLWKRKKIY
jgi:hypothetical protein